eukprot:g2544.t1
MAENDTGAAMDLEDINLPLDEIISRKAHREGAVRPPRSRGFRKHPYQQRRQPLPLPPHPPSFNQMEPPTIPEQTGPHQLPPFFHQTDPNFTPQPYNWNHPGAGAGGGFNHNPMEQCWMTPQPMGQGEVNFRRRQPVRKQGFNRGGIHKPLGRRHPPRHLSQDHHQRRRPIQSDDEKQREEDRCKLQFEKGVASILYRGVEIVKTNSTGDVTLTTNGNQESGFLKTMNDVLGLINMEILGEEDKKDQWKIKDNRTLFRYYDGITIKGKGDLSKSRSETIRKAFEQPNPKALEATLASNLAARRLGLAFDPMSANAQSQFPNAGPHGMAPNGGSICITQDQQLTRTSNYSISFLDQERAQHEGAYGPVYHPPPGPMPQGGRFLHPY